MRIGTQEMYRRIRLYECGSAEPNHIQPGFCPLSLSDKCDTLNLKCIQSQLKRALELADKMPEE